jgi:N-methylhydantoinase B
MATRDVMAEILKSNLEALSEEMLHLLTRSAYSTLTRESRDCSFLALDDQARVPVTVYHSYSTIYPEIVKAIYTRYGREAVRPGDIYLCNHPYLCGVPHPPDLAVAEPVFVGGELVAWSATIAHKPDFGGASPGSVAAQATELYQEGFLLPVVRLYAEGVLQPDIEQIILTNVRNPDMVLGDVRAQVGVTRVGAERLRQIFERYGTATVREAFETLMDVAEARLRSLVREWRDGSESVVGYLDNDGVDLERPIKYAVTVSKQGEQFTFDFSDCEPQTVGPVNLLPSHADQAITYALLCLTDPTLTYNEGVRRLYTTKYRESGVINPTAPAPTGMSTVTIHKISDLLLEALSRFSSGRAVAHSGGSGGTLAFQWQGAPGERRYVQYEVLGSALGGGNGGDGLSGVGVHTSNLALTPIEILENQYPVRFEAFELVQDAGGPGEQRGGLSYRRAYTLLRPAVVNRRADRVKTQPSGANGGQNGRTGRLLLRKEDGTVTPLPGSGKFQLQPGDTLIVEGAGGGGYGNPLQRPPELVAQDVARGYVSPEQAREAYGVVVSADGKGLDVEATERLRKGRVVN